MYASPSPMSDLQTTFWKREARRTRTTAVCSAGAARSPSQQSAPVGRMRRMAPPRESIASPKRRKRLRQARGTRPTFASHEKGSHGTTGPPPQSASTARTAEAIPSSWKPYPHHAPVGEA